MSRLRLGLAMLAAGAVLLYASFAQDIPFVDLGGDGRHVRAVFADTDQLQRGDPVRVGGIDVGAVESIDLDAGGSQAIVTMSIDESDVRLRRDAQAAIRWRTLLGGSLAVSIEPGSPSAPPAPDDHVIPRQRTDYQVEYDDLLRPFDLSTRAHTRNMMRELRRGFADADATGQAIDALSPALSTVARGAGPLRGSRDDDLRRLVTSAGRTVEAVGRNGKRLRQLIDDGAATLETVADNRESLGDGLELSPAAFDSTRLTMTRLRRTLDHLDPLAARLRPGARSLAPSLRAARPTLRQADALLREAKPLLRLLPGTVHELAGAARQGTPLIADLRPTLERLDSEILPWLARRDPETQLRTYEAIAPTTAVVSSAVGEFDRGGYFIHFPTSGDERGTLTVPCQTFFTDPTAEEKLRCEALETLLGRLLPPPEDRSR